MFCSFCGSRRATTCPASTLSPCLRLFSKQTPGDAKGEVDFVLGFDAPGHRNRRSSLALFDRDGADRSRFGAPPLRVSDSRPRSTASTGASSYGPAPTSFRSQATVPFVSKPQPRRRGRPIPEIDASSNFESARSEIPNTRTASSLVAFSGVVEGSASGLDSHLSRNEAYGFMPRDALFDRQATRQGT